MRLTWHIVAKDLWRHRWAMLLLAAVSTAKMGFGTHWSVQGVMAGSLLVFLETLLSYVLVAALIHEDLPVGVGAEWRTRPISGARLLGAKLLGLALALGLMPVLVLLPWWLGYGYGGGEIARAVGETWLGQSVVVVVALPLATLTDGYARFLLWTLITIFSETIFSLVKTADLGDVKPGLGLVATRWWVALALAAVTSLTVTVHQFMTQRRERSVALLVAGWAAMVMVAWFWPWTWVADEPSQKNVAGAGITLTSGPAERRERPNGKIAVTVPLVTHGLAAGEVVGGATATMGQTWTWSGAEKVELIATLATNWEPQAARLLGLNPVAGGSAAKTAPLTVTTEMEPAWAGRLRSERPALSGGVRLRRLLVGPTGEQPLRAGQKRAVGAWSQRITDIGVEGDQVKVTLIERGAVFFGRENGIALGALVPWRTLRSSYWIVDRATKRLVQGGRLDADAMRVGTVQTTRIIVRFPTHEFWPATTTEAEIVEGVQGMVLAKIDYEDRGEITVPVAIPQLETAW